jgi:hypothetical protein
MLLCGDWSFGRKCVAEVIAFRPNWQVLELSFYMSKMLTIC